MTIAPENPSVEPADDDAVAAELESAEREARDLFLDQQRAELPDYLDIDDDGNIVPAKGFQLCPACRGTTVIPESYPRSPELIPCPHCDGWGKVSTGSRLSETANLGCDSCQGNGFVRKTDWLAIHPEDAGRFDGA